MEIPLPSNKHALIVKQVIEVDAELQPNAVKRELSVQDDRLIAYVFDFVQLYWCASCRDSQDIPYLDRQIGKIDSECFSRKCRSSC